MTYACRADAAIAADHAGAVAFSCIQDDKLTWHWRHEPYTERVRFALDWAKKHEFVHHIECHAGEPIAVVRCVRADIPKVDLPLRVAPLDPAMWHYSETKLAMQRAPAKTAKGTSIPRRTSIPGAVGKAWQIFDDNADMPRSDLIDMCVAAGVNINTAKAQHHRWKVANNR